MNNHPSNTTHDYVCNLPPKTNRFTERTVFFDKEYTIIRQSSYRSLGSSNYSIVEKTVEAKRVRYCPRWSFALLMISIFLLITVLLFNNNLLFADPSEEAETTLTDTIESESPPTDSLISTEDILAYITAYIPLENGMVFPNSSSEIISDSILQNLKSKYDIKIYAVLLRMGVNEIYSRNGYVFTTPFWDTYYSQQDWYTPRPQSNIDFSSFNETERSNLEALLRAEELLNQ